MAELITQEERTAFEVTAARKEAEETDRKNRTANSATVANPDWREKRLSANPLNDHDQVAYHVEWFFCPETEVRKYQDPTVSHEKKREALETRITLVETGVTSRYSLNSLDFESRCGAGNENRGIITTRIKMEMFESQGLTLFDKFLEIGRDLNINRITNIPSFIRVYWNGYKDTGELDEKIGNYEFIWPVTVVKVNPEIDVTGTTYSVEMVHTNDEGMSAPVIKIQEAIDFNALTLAEFFPKLENELNRQKEDQIGYWRPFLEEAGITPSNGKNIYIKFKPEPLLKELKRLSKDLTFISGIENVTIGTKGDEKGFKLTPDMDLRNIVNAALIEVITSIPKIELEKDPFTEKLKNLVGIRTSTEYGLFIEDTQEYAKSYTFEFYLLDVSRMVTTLTGNKTSQASAEDAKQPKLLDRIDKANFLKRMYTYNFSGQNVDVLSLDVKLDPLWGVTLSANSFFIEEVENTSKDATIKKPKVINAETIATLNDQQALGSIIGRLRADVKKEKSSDVHPTEKETLLSAALARKNELKQQNNDAAVQQARAQADASDRIGKGKRLAELNNSDDSLQKTSKTIQSSGVIKPKAHISWDKDISKYTITTQDTVDLKSRMRASIVEQAFNDANGTFLRIEMEIMGDPYWIGNPEIISQENGANANSVANYSRGEHSFFFEYLTPQRIDEKTGLMIKDEGYFLKGIYNVQIVASTFADGKFTQKLSAVRNPNIKF